MNTVRVARQRPEPRRFWIAWTPAEEAAASGEGRWRVDLGRGALVRARGRLGPWRPRLDVDLDDAVYIPPDEAAAVMATAEALRARGAPAVVQVLPGEAGPVAASDLLVVVDLTEEALAADPHAQLSSFPQGAFACWPLVAGVSDGSERFAAVCERLARLGAAGVCALALDLSPDDRRAIAERREDWFAALFHRGSPDESLERICDEIAERHGLAFVPPRPLPRVGASRRLLVNRRVAEALARTADVARRRGGSEAAVAALLRAQRMADATPYDLEALAREGNLGVLDWLDEDARRVATQALAAAGAS